MPETPNNRNSDVSWLVVIDRAHVIFTRYTTSAQDGGRAESRLAALKDEYSKAEREIVVNTSS